VLAGPGGAHARPFERLMAEGYAWRRAGDLAKAKAAYTQALGLPHDSIEPETGLAEIALEQNHYAEASRIARAALDARPQDLQARRFARDIHAAEGWILDTQVKPSDSEGGGANAANGAIAAHVGLSSPPVEDNWRFFVAGDYADAHPPEGFVDRARVEAGAVWATPVVSASLYGGQNWGSLTKASGGATVDWSPTSRIHVGLAAEFYSWDTPLRALPHDIWADEYSARITWRWSDADSVSAGFAYLPFTDGNRRYGESITLSHRLYSGPDLDLTGTAEVYVSQNNRPQAPYYNPDHDLTADVGFTAAQRLWRRGDTILTQVLLVNAGVYAEAHFPADVIATTRYEHRWRFDPWMEVDYGVELSRRVYDGSPETTVALVAGLRRRF
jgi:tetratricopeptide (TPR) repeat protein